MGLSDDADAHLQREAQRAREREEEEARLDEPFREDWTLELTQLLLAHEWEPFPIYVVTERIEKHSFFSHFTFREQVSFWADGWSLQGVRPSLDGWDPSPVNVVLTTDGSMWGAGFLGPRTSQPAQTITRGFRPEHESRHLVYNGVPRPGRCESSGDWRETVGVHIATILRQGLTP